MSLKVRYPAPDLQKAITALLSAEQSTPIYDCVPYCKYGTDGKPVLDVDGNMVPVDLPYMTFGMVECDLSGAKDLAIYDISQKILLWSEYDGKMELWEIANTVVGILSTIPIDLSAARFKILMASLSPLRAGDAEEYGYQMELTLTAKIQDLGGV